MQRPEIHMKKTTRWALPVAAVCVANVVVGLLGATKAAEPPPVPQAQARADLYGDPLPPGALARLGTIRWRHEAPVTFVAFTPDGKALVTASQAGTLRLWDRRTGQEIRRFEQKGGEKRRPRDGGYQRMAMTGWGGYGSGELLVALAPDGKTLATANPGSTIQLWEVATGRALRQIEPPQGVPGFSTFLFSPDSKTLAARAANQTIHLFETATGKGVRQIQPQQREIRGPVNVVRYRGPGDLVFAPDGKTLGSVETFVETLAGNQKLNTVLRLLETATGKETRQIALERRGGGGVAFSPDGKVLAYADGDTIHLCAADTGQSVSQIQGQGAAITGLAFAPDSKTVVVRSARGAVARLFAVPTGAEIRVIGAGPTDQGRNVLFRPYLPASQDLAFSPDGKHLAIGSGNTVRLWAAATGTEIVPWPGHREAVTYLAVTADGKLAASQAGDNIIHLWDLATGKERSQFRAPLRTTGVALAPDGQTVALGNGDGTIRMHDTATGKELHRVMAHPNGVARVAFAPDGKTLATRGAADNTIRLWDPASGQQRRLIAIKPQAKPGGGQAFVVVGGALNGTGLGLVFSPDSKIVASPVLNMTPINNFQPGMPAGGYRPNTLNLWDVATGKEIRRIELPTQVGLATFAFTPDGRMLVTQNTDRTITLLETAGGKERGRLGQPVSGQAQPGQVMSVGGNFVRLPGYGRAAVATNLPISPDGRTVAAMGPGQSVRLWDILTGKAVGHLAGHTGSITALALTRDGKTLVSSSSDTTALVWDVSPFHPKVQQKQEDVKAEELEALWADLGGVDAGTAWRGINRLARAPGLAVPFLRQHLQATARIPAGKLERLIAALDSEKFRVRQQAMSELEKFGELAEPALTKVLAAHSSLETQRRVEQLMDKITQLTLAAEQVRLVRSLEVLERLDTTDARQLLTMLADGAPGALPTREAQAALERLSGAAPAQRR